MSTDTEITVEQFIEKHGITMTVQPAGSNPNMENSHTMDNWRCCFSFPCAERHTRLMEVYFSVGVGHNGKAPEAADVLDCMASDSAGIDNNQTFEDWAGEYGYDPDSRKAEKTYRACLEQAEKLKTFLGADAFDELLYHTERR